MIDFFHLFSTPNFKNFIIPLFTIIITSTIKIASRKDTELKTTRNDWNFGFNLIIGAIVLVLNQIFSQVQNLCQDGAPEIQKEDIIKMFNAIILMGFFWFIAYILSIFIRKFGWREDSKELKWGLGIVLPILIGFLFLYVAVNSQNS